MASLGDGRGPYSLDYNLIRHRGVQITTTLHSDVLDNLANNLESLVASEVGYVPAGYEHRPDLISNVFYGTPNNWWLLMLANNITDPIEGFYLNQEIIIPKI